MNPEAAAKKRASLDKLVAERKLAVAENQRLKAIGDPRARYPGGDNAYTELRKAQAQAKRDRLIALLTEGYSIRAGLVEIGVAESTLSNWYRKHSGFKVAVHAAKQAAVEAGKQSVDRGTRSGWARFPKGATVDDSDFVAFRKAFFARDTPAHHQLVVDAIERAKPGQIVMVLGFPGMAKTSTLVDYVNHAIALDPNVRVAILSESQDLARKTLGQISTRCSDTARFGPYIAAYGPFRTPVDPSKERAYAGRDNIAPWTADYFRVFKADHDEKEPTVESKGVGSQLYGGRYDLMIYDDLQSTKNLDATTKILNWLRQDALTRPGAGGGRHIIIGSRVGRGDIYETLQAEGMIAQTVTIPALDRWVEKEQMYDVAAGEIFVRPECPAKPTWDAWSLTELAQRREHVGEEIWTRTYMQRDYTPRDATFTVAMLEQAKDRTAALGASRGTYTILSVDPALTRGICAFLVADVTADGLWVRDLVTAKALRRYEEVYAHIASLAAKYRPNDLVIETNNFQAGMTQDDRIYALRSLYGFDIIEHKTNRNKHDPVLGVAMMASAFSAGEMHLPWLGENEHAALGELTDELRTWSPSKRGAELKMDTVMALWFAWKRWSEIRKTKLSATVALEREIPSWMRGQSRRGIA